VIPQRFLLSATVENGFVRRSLSVAAPTRSTMFPGADPMPLFGAHMSIAGGLYQAILIAQKHQCLLVNDPRFRCHPMILETPKEKTAEGDMDMVNLKVLRSLLRRA
jgi:hypothetical protein